MAISKSIGPITGTPEREYTTITGAKLSRVKQKHGPGVTGPIRSQS